MEPTAVAVYGATGHTGKFVLRELGRRGYRAVAIGRTEVPPSASAHAIAQCDWRRAACDDPDALDEALRGTRALINCAGPFLDTAPALVEAALRAGIHYFDITAEQRSARQSLATYHEEARQRGTVVVPSVAFYGGLADLLAAELTRGTSSIERIEVGVALDSWHPTTGTRRTGDRNTARRFIVVQGRVTPLPHPAPAREWTFPEPFGTQHVVAMPLAEIVTISRHIAARNVCSYINSTPLRDLDDPRTPVPLAADASGRSSQRFMMHVRANSDHRWTEIVAGGRDIYAVSAPIVVEACARVLEHPPVHGGAFAPAQLFDASEFLTALSPHLAITRLNGGPAVRRH